MTTKRKLRKPAVYAIYRGDDFLVVGTASECSEFMGWRDGEVTRIRSTPSHKKRMSNHKSGGRRIEVFRLENCD